jgi:hypothetical protein
MRIGHYDIHFYHYHVYASHPVMLPVSRKALVLHNDEVFMAGWDSSLSIRGWLRRGIRKRCSFCQDEYSFDKLGGEV